MSRTVFTTLSNKKKMKNTLFIVLIIFILFTLRLAYIQFVWGSELSEKALEQQSQSRTITAKRGTIYDSTGKYILAENSSVESISINPTNIPQEIKDKVAHALCDIFELDYEKISKKEALKKAEDMLRKTGVPRVEHMMKEYPFQLSGGQRQRVMIAMALVCKPEILIADEPTTALDVTIQAQILDLMNQLKKETGTSILFITHDLGVVAEVCDDVAVMYCGRVVERGDVKTIFANPSHPYTKGLLGSIPRLGDAGKELKSIPGNVPNPKYMPKGCKFEPRCPYASEKCREEEPGFFQIEEGHISRCWLCESGQLKTDHVEKAGD